MNKPVNSNTMATIPTIDPALLRKALEVGGEETTTATVNKALREFIVRREQVRLLQLFETLDWDEGFDCKRKRSRF